MLTTGGAITVILKIQNQTAGRTDVPSDEHYPHQTYTHPFFQTFITFISNVFVFIVHKSHEQCKSKKAEQQPYNNVMIVDTSAGAQAYDVKETIVQKKINPLLFLIPSFLLNIACMITYVSLTMIAASVY